jgi:predicted enzyme related to lactoylglutathione lyase
MRAGRICLLLSLCLAVTARGQAPTDPPLPPLTDTEGAAHLPGKFVWADLFTDDLTVAQTFYERLFDWQLRWVNTDVGARYGMFYKDDAAVAGLVYRAAPDGAGPYGRWVHYLSVPDVAAAARMIEARGGRTLLQRRTIEARGEFGIYATSDGAIIGFMRSQSGDPGDYRALSGEWLWHQLFTYQVDPAAELYQTLVGYALYAKEDTPETDFILSRDGYARAGIGALAADSETHPTWLGFIRVADIPASVDQARVLGAEVLYRPDEGTGLEDLAVIADPNGALVGLLRYEYPQVGEGSP